MNIPYLNFRRSFGHHRAFVADTLAGTAATGDFILKRNVLALEEAIGKEIGVSNAIATASASGGIVLALKAMGVGLTQEVIVPAFGFPSPVSCILHLCGTPVFVDVDPDSGVMNPDQLGACVTRKTLAILPMHLGRALADMAAITQFAGSRSLKVLEDSAVALGAQIDGVSAGRWGDAAVFSFFPSKPLGGIGDAGMLVTDDDELADRCRRLRNHGQVAGKRFVYEEIGWNSRMDEISAAYLLMKLLSFPAQLERRAEIARYYERAFDNASEDLAIIPGARADCGHHAYVVRVEARESLRRCLADAGIGTQPFHPTPLHLHPGFASLGYRAGDFPVAEWLAARTLALPFYPELTNEEVDFVIERVLGFYGK